MTYHSNQQPLSIKTRHTTIINHPQHLTTITYSYNVKEHLSISLQFLQTSTLGNKNHSADLFQPTAE